MEKWIHLISSIVTTLVIYVFAAYTYLSYKGFVYQNGTFELTSNANAGLLDFSFSDDEKEEKPQKVILAKDIALNFPQTVIAGDETAPLTIYEFSSLGCTHCADFHLNGLPKLEKNYLSQNKVRIVFIHFPLDKRSMLAAMLSECVGPEKKADFLNLVFSKQREWVLSNEVEKHLINYAVMSGMELGAAKGCLKNEDLAKEILYTRQEAIDKLKIEGTPAFLVSNESQNEILYGISSMHNFKAYLDERLEQKEAKN